MSAEEVVRQEPTESTRTTSGRDQCPVCGGVDTQNCYRCRR